MTRTDDEYAFLKSALPSEEGTLDDLRYAYFKSQVPGVEGTLPDLQLAFLRSFHSAGDRSLQDLIEVSPFYWQAAAGPTYAEEVLADGPLLYYKLNESVAPAVDSGSAASVPTAYETWPVFGAAGLGDGATSANFQADLTKGIDTNYTRVGAPAGWTVEALVNLASFATSQTMLDSSALAGNGSLIFLVMTTGKLRVWTDAPAWPTATESNVALTLGEHHLAATVDAAGVLLYVDGAPVAATGTAVISPNSREWMIGRRNQTSDSFKYTFRDRLAGVAVYDKVLSAPRIAAHAAAAGY